MEKNKKHRIIILILLLITVVAVAVAIWAMFFRNDDVVLAPDSVPEIEGNVEDIPNDSDDKLEQPEGGSSVSLTFSKDVSINLKTEEIELLFANPGKSNMDMVLQIIIQDEVIAQTGALNPGKQLNSTTLIKGMKKKLTKGIYEGKFNVLYYSLETGEKAVVNTEIPVSITVH